MKNITNGIPFQNKKKSGDLTELTNKTNSLESQLAQTVKSVNGVTPDTNGNVSVTGSGSGVETFATKTDVETAYPDGHSVPVWVTGDNSWYFWDGTTTGDTTAPNDVTNLTVTSYETSVDLAWTASTSSDVASYDVYQGTTLLGNVIGATYTASGLTAGTQYTFTVKAKDTSGNVSAGVSVTTTTTTTTTANLYNSSTNVTGYEIEGSTGNLKTSGGTYTASDWIQVTPGAKYDTNKEHLTTIDTSGTTLYYIFQYTSDKTYKGSVYTLANSDPFTVAGDTAWLRINVKNTIDNDLVLTAQ